MCAAWFRRNAGLPQSPDQDYTLEEVILRIVEDCAFRGVRSALGHVSRANITLPSAFDRG